MRVSLNLIKKYVDLPSDLTEKQIAYDLTLRTVEVESVENVCEKFEKALDDDLNMPLALSYFFEFISEVNKHFDILSEKDKKEILVCLYRLDEVLALIPEVSSELTEEQEKMIQEREEYRKLKQWDKADALKQELLKMGIEIKDTPHGPLVKKLNLA